MQTLSRWVDQLSDFFAHRKGLLPLIGIALVVANLIIVLFAPGWLASTNLLLHLGVIVAILGFLLARAL